MSLPYKLFSCFSLRVCKIKCSWMPTQYKQSNKGRGSASVAYLFLLSALERIAGWGLGCIWRAAADCCSRMPKSMLMSSRSTSLRSLEELTKGWGGACGSCCASGPDLDWSFLPNRFFFGMVIFFHSEFYAGASAFTLAPGVATLCATPGSHAFCACSGYHWLASLCSSKVSFGA